MNNKEEKKPLFSYRFTKKHLILGIVAAVCLIGSLACFIIQRTDTSSVRADDFKDRWAEGKKYAQIGVFFPVDLKIEKDRFDAVYHAVESALKEVSKEPEKKGQRIFVDCYYEKGSIDLTNDKNHVEITAYGVSKDFFLFHSFEYVSGTPIPADELMRDYVVIDEKTAWDLYGATNVAGMYVYVQNVPHIISGVIKRPEDKISEMAGYDECIAYVTTDTLESYGTTNGYMGYEVLMPEEFSGYAQEVVTSAFEDVKDSVVITDISKRFKIVNLMKNFTKRNERMMRKTPIMYPAWENVGVFYEAKAADLCMASLILLAIPALFLFVLLLRIWHSRNFHKSDFKEYFIRFVEWVRARKEERKKNKELGIETENIIVKKIRENPYIQKFVQSKFYEVVSNSVFVRACKQIQIVRRIRESVFFEKGTEITKRILLSMGSNLHGIFSGVGKKVNQVIGQIMKKMPNQKSKKKPEQEKEFSEMLQEDLDHKE